MSAPHDETPCARGLHPQVTRWLRRNGHPLAEVCAACEPAVRALFHADAVDDPFAAAEAANVERAKVEALARLQREREARRNMQPLPSGGLFDEVRRATLTLFD